MKKTLVVGFCALNFGLAAFATGITVPAGESQTLTSAMSLDENVDVAGSLTLDGKACQVRPSGELDGSKLNIYLGTNVQNRATLIITNGALMTTFHEKRSGSDFQLHFQNIYFGNAEIDISDNVNTDYAGWSYTYNLNVGSLYVTANAPTRDTGYADVMRLRGKRGLFGTYDGIYNNSASTARILFDGGILSGYQTGNNYGIIRKGAWRFESTEGNDIKIFAWWGHGGPMIREDGVTKSIEFAGPGKVVFIGTKTDSSTYYVRMTDAIVWNQTGDVVISNMHVRLENDYALSRIQTNGQTVVRRVQLVREGGMKLDLKGHTETLDYFTAEDFPFGVTILDSDSQKRGRLLFSSNKGLALLNKLTVDSSCSPEVFQGVGTFSLTDAVYKASFILKDSTLQISNAYHWVCTKFGWWASENGQWSPEGRRDLAPGYVDCLKATDTVIDVTRGALVVSNAVFSGDSLVHIRTNSGFRVQAQQTWSEKYFRLTLKEARGPGYWIHLKALRLRDADNAELFCGKSFTHNTTATKATELSEGEYMFNQGAVWTDGLARNMSGTIFNNNYVCDDTRFSRDAGWGGLCITNTFPRRADPASWNVITIRLKEASKPLQGWIITSNWTQLYFPGCWSVEVSATGEDGSWTTIDEKCDYYCYRYSGHNADTDELGGTYEGYNTFNDATAFSANKFYSTTNNSPSSVGLALNGARIQVDAGGVFDALQTGGENEVSALRVDGDNGAGTLKGLNFAASGALDLVMTAERPARLTSVKIRLESCQNVDNLKKWVITYNGSVPDDYVLNVESYDSVNGILTIRKIRQGMIMLLK